MTIFTVMKQSFAKLLLCMVVIGASALAQTTGATFGDVIALGYTPSDTVIDELRGRLYLVRNSANSVDVLDTASGKVVKTISVGTTPLAAALSMDNNWLYVTNNGNSSLSVIDLSIDRVVQTVLLPSRPEGVEVGVDGRVLINMAGSGVVAGVPQGMLAVFDRAATASQQVINVSAPALNTTPPGFPGVSTARPVTTFRGKLIRTPKGDYIIGMIPPSNAAYYIFVYEVASGTILMNRTVSGASSVLAMSPDGASFMAGATMYNTRTLAVLGQQTGSNAPFPFSANFNLIQNVGGSHFSADGSLMYSAFNLAPNAVPAPRPQASTLLISDSKNLSIKLGIKLPESLVAKMVMTSNGSDAWGASESGLLHLPLAKLYDYPIIAPETTTVFLSMDECNRTLSSSTLRITNLGKGRLTFTIPSTGGSLIAQQSSGLAPATIAFTMDPGRSGIVRQAGTNIWTGSGTQSGTVFTVSLASNEAINLPNSIRVYMNYRQIDQRGQIFPIPTVPNNGNEGLQDLLLDEKRGKLYITNSGYNRIEVFDLKKLRLTDPIPVGQLPHAMALSLDGNTLYVGNTFAESISIVDLDQQRVVDSVTFPPYPRTGTANPVGPRTMAMGKFGLQFIMSNGTQWKLSGSSQATFRAPGTVIPTNLGGGPFAMTATPGNEYIFTLVRSGNTAAGFLYDSNLDTYTSGRTLFTNPLQGYFGVLGAAPQGAYFLANGLVLNPSLTVIAGSERPGSTGIAPPPAPGQPPTQVVVNNGQRNVAAVYPLTRSMYLRMTTPVRQNVTTATRDDARPTLEIVNNDTLEETLAAVAPENPIFNALGTTSVTMPPRQIAVDSKGTVFALTLSGLSMIPIIPPVTPAIQTGVRGIVNSADGSPNIRPGSFITITGTNLANAATADTLPVPTVLGGSCVTFGDISVPLLQTSPTQIQAQVPAGILAGTQVVQVRSLLNAQNSGPVIVTVQRAGSATPTPDPQPDPVPPPPDLTEQ